MRIGRGASRGPPGRLRPLLSALAAEDPRRLGWLMVVAVLAAIGQGLGLLLLVPLLVVAGVSGSGSSGGLVGVTRDALAAGGVPLTVRAMLVVYVVVVAVAAGLAAYQSVLLTRYRLRFVDGLRSRLYAAVAGASWRHLLGVRQSDLLSVLTVSVGLVGQGTLAVLNLGVAACVVAVQVAVAVRISPVITGLAAATGAALMALVWPLVRRSRRLGAALIADNRRVLGSVTGFLDGLKLAKAHGLGPRHVAIFDETIRRSRRSQIDFATAGAVATAIQLIVTAVVLAVLVDFAVEAIALPLANVLVLAFIFTRLVAQITAAQQNVQTAAQALPAAQELLATVESCEAAAEDPPGAAAGRREIGSGVRLERVSFAYPGGPEILHDVSIELTSRRTTALVGPSGAGKTTVADLVTGLLTPSAGIVAIDGRPLDGETLGAWRAAVGLAPQEPFLFHDTIRANLLWARGEANEDDLWAALELAMAAGLVAGLPDGLDTVVGDRGGRLSGGERQRIALARALLREPQLLVLDEATSSLDSEHELAIRRALAGLRGRMTMLVIAHRLSTVSHADAIVVLDGGRVVEQGGWEELSRRGDGRLRALIDAGEVV